MSDYENLDDYFKKNNIKVIEGNTSQVKEQQDKLVEILKKYNIKNILEIGFNGGHSSELFLNNSDANVTSFDLGEHDYVKEGKKYIDMKFPNRHILITGDSTKTIPEYISKNKDKVFDMLFIDGGHTYEIATKDLENCKKLANENSIVIMDDTVDEKDFLKCFQGPTKAWKDGIKNNLIKNIEDLYLGSCRGMSYGNYVFEIESFENFKKSSKNYGTLILLFILIIILIFIIMKKYDLHKYLKKIKYKF